MAVDDYVLPSSKFFQKSLVYMVLLFFFLILQDILWQDTSTYFESFIK